MKIIVTLCATAVTLALTPPPHTPVPASLSKDVHYHYCVGGGKGKDHNNYYSAPFAATYDISYWSATGMENSYRAYLEGERGATIFSVNCLGPFNSMREARDEENQAISLERISAKYTIVMTHWQYSGD